MFETNQQLDVVSLTNEYYQEQTNQIDIFSILPYSKEMLLTDRTSKLRILYLIKYIASELVIVQKQFYFQQSFSQFDPLVGDTLCQLRAYKLLLMYNQHNNIKSFNESKSKLERLQFIKNTVGGFFDYFLEASNQFKDKKNYQLDKKISLEQFILENDIYFDIDHDLFFIFQCYFLTKYGKFDSEGISNSIDYDKLNFHFAVAKSFARKSVLDFQQNLAKSSCDFIDELLDSLPENKNIKILLPYLKKIDHKKRSVYPFFDSTIVLLNHILRTNTPVLVIVKLYINNVSKFVPILYDVDEDRFILKNAFSSLNENTPCFVIFGTQENTRSQSGEKEYIEKFNNIGLENIIIANMASHPQYSSDEFNNISDNHYKPVLTWLREEISINIDSGNSKELNDLLEILSSKENYFLSMKNFSEEIGCCLKNKDTFFLKHIFCAKIKDVLQKYNIYKK